MSDVQVPQTNVKQGPGACVEEIQSALEALCPSDTFEVRIPKSGRTKVVAGYFDDPQRAALEVAGYDGKVPGIYATMNPVESALRSRADGRLKPYADTTTSDSEVTARRHLLVDIDPVRASGISATDEEKAYAFAKTAEVEVFLAEQGWPYPVEVDSGNGWHLLYRVDLPNDNASTALIKRVLDRLAARFDDDQAKIDRTVYNAARIVKVPGTMACKGDSTAERPHRRSRLLRVPSELRIVTREQLEALPAPDRKGTEQPDAAERARTGESTSAAWFDEWLAQHPAVEVKRGPEAYDGGRRWIVGCPFVETHGQGSDTAIIQLASGALIFRCQHNGCADKHWSDFRRHYEPDLDRGPSPNSSAENPFEQAVAKEMSMLRVREEARRRITAELGPREPFDVALLADVADEPVRWRVEGLLASEGRLVVAAQRKGGKTTAELNLARDLIVGGEFLGRFCVSPIAGRVAFLNFEVSRHQLACWARDIGIPGDRLLTVHLRGRSNPFARPDDTARLVEVLRAYGVEIIFVDPFSRAYSGKSANDPGEVTAWLSELDRFATSAGCSELILAAHMGWEGERTRGASALEDWADTIAYLPRDKEDDRLRYFHARGRDVEVEEDRLLFDPNTRRLTLAGTGSRTATRAQRRTEELVAGIVEAVTREPGATTHRLEVLLRDAGLGVQRGDAGRGARAAADAGQIIRAPGPRNSFLHFLPGQQGASKVDREVVE